ncbi:unnamed protein product [Lymnaea stagnalis]|uniref:Uncharacterized protein n=1 Tax=Lymnaea stagnalis TaxID=6523 RepID=A0AAV2IKY2_LYMST
MGEIHEALGQPAEALDSFKRAYENGGPRFWKLVKKIGDLQCDVGADVQTLKFWLEQCERFFPQSSAAVKLKACINNYAGMKESRSAKEQVQNKDDLSLHIKSLNDFSNHGRWDKAYEAAVSCNLEIKFVEEFHWFDYLQSVFQEYGIKNPDVRLTYEYNLHYLYILRNFTYLSLCTRDVNICVRALKSFEQHLNHALSLDMSDNTWHGLMKEIKGQFFYLAGVLLLKKAQYEIIALKTAIMAAGACFLTSYKVDPINSNEQWIKDLPQHGTKFYKWWYLQSYDRVSQIGHILNKWSSCNFVEWSKNITHQFMTPDGQKYLYKLLFGNEAETKEMKQSFFDQSRELLDKSALRTQLTDRQLAEIDKVACKLHLCNLSHLVWLCQQHYSTDMDMQPHYPFFTIEDFQYGVRTMDNGVIGSLCQTDILVFLLATVRCSSQEVSDSSVIDTSWHRFTMPVCLTQDLCTPEQAEWWAATYNYCTSKYKSEFSDVRRILVKGIETVRLVAQHGMSLPMMVHIARSLSAKVKALMEVGNDYQCTVAEIKAIEMRAQHYWEKIKTYLEKLQRYENLQVTGNRLFEEPQDMELSQEQIELYQSESTFALALASMNRSDYARAVEGFKKIGSADASLYCAKAYKQWAKKEIFEDDGTEEKHLWIEELLLLSRDLLYTLMETRMGDKHLMELVKSELDEVELIIHKDKVSEIQDSFWDSGFFQTPLKSEPDYKTPSGVRRNLFNGTSIQQDSRAGIRYASQVVQVNRSSPFQSYASHQIRNLHMSQQQLERSVVIRNSAQQQKREDLIQIITERNDQIIAVNNQMIKEVRDNTSAIKKSVEQNSELIKDLQSFVAESKNVVVEIQKEIKGLKTHSSVGQSPTRPLHLATIQQSNKGEVRYLPRETLPEQNNESIRFQQMLRNMPSELQKTDDVQTQAQIIRSLPAQFLNPGQYQQQGTLPEQYQQPGTVTGQYQQPSTAMGQYQKPGTAMRQYKNPGTAMGQYQQPDTAMGQYQQPGTAMEQYQQPGIAMGLYQQQGTLPGQHQQLGTHTRHYQQSGNLTPYDQHTGTKTSHYQDQGLFAAHSEEPNVFSFGGQFSANVTQPQKANTPQQKSGKGEKSNKKSMHGAQSQEPDTTTPVLDREEISQALLDNVLDKVRQEMKSVEKKHQEQTEREKVLQAQMEEFLKAQREMQEKLIEETEQKRREQLQKEHKELMEQKEMLIKEREHAQKLERNRKNYRRNW